MGDFDPYHLWLQIPPKDQPPTHYRLLGLVDFESDATVIDNAAEQRLLHLRNVQNGPKGQIAQNIMNEVSRARLTLLNDEARAAYDKELKAKLAASQPQPTASTSNTGAAVELPPRVGGRPAAASSNGQDPIASQTQPVITQKATTKSLAYARAKKKKAMTTGIVVVVLLALVGGGIYFAMTSQKNGGDDESGADQKTADQSENKKNDGQRGKTNDQGKSNSKKKTNASDKKTKSSSNAQKQTGPSKRQTEKSNNKKSSKSTRNNGSSDSNSKPDSPSTKKLDALYTSTFSKEVESKLASGDTVDMLPLLEFPKAVRQGVIRRQKSRILFESTDSINHVEFPVLLPASYDIEATVTRLSPEDGFGIGMHVANKPCFLMIDGYPVSGFKTGLRKLEADINSPLRTDVTTGQILKYNQAAQLKVQVRPTGVQLLVDGELKYKYVGNPSKIETVPIVLPGTTNFFRFWLMSWKTRFQIENVKLTPRGPESQRSDWLESVTVDDTEELSQPVELLNKFDASYVLQQPVVKNRFGLAIGPGRHAGTEIPHELPREYDLKMNVVATGDQGLAVVVPVGDRKTAVMIDSVVRSGGKSVARTGVQTFHGRYIGQGIHPGFLPVKLLPKQKEIQVEIKVRVDSIRVHVDGNFVYGWAGTRYELGPPTWTNYPRSRNAYVRIASLSNQVIVKKLSFRSVTRFKSNLAQQAAKLQEMNPSLKEFWDLHAAAQKEATQLEMESTQSQPNRNETSSSDLNSNTDPAIAKNEIDSKRIQWRTFDSDEKQEVDLIAEEIEKVAGLLKEKKFDAASSAISATNRLAKLAESKRMIGAIAQVLRDIRAFWGAMPSRCALLKATQQLEFSDSTVVVVAASKDQITLRIAGESKSFSPDELPVGLAMKIMDVTTSNKTGVYHRMKGNVFYLESFSSSEHRDNAIRYWLEAEKMDVDIDGLLTLVSE